MKKYSYIYFFILVSLLHMVLWLPCAAAQPLVPAIPESAFPVPPHAIHYVSHGLSHPPVITQNNRLPDTLHTPMPTFPYTVLLLSALGLLCLVLWIVNRSLQAKHTALRQILSQQYQHIYEVNLTRDRIVGGSARDCFTLWGIPKRTPYHTAIQILAEREVKEDFRAEYLATFSAEHLLHAYQKGTTFIQHEYMVYNPQKEYARMRMEAFLCPIANGRTIYVFLCKRRICACELSGQDCYAQTDEMTGLYAKMATERAIRKLLIQTPQNKYALLIFDIDNFKQANDQHGHIFGDAVIIAFSKALRRQFRSGDLVGRIGGDEFAAFLPFPNEVWLQQKVQSLVKELNQTYQIGETKWKLSCSIGIAVYPRDGLSFELLYKNADRALYQSKSAGKNSYSFFSQDTNTRSF